MPAAANTVLDLQYKHFHFKYSHKVSNALSNIKSGFNRVIQNIGKCAQSIVAHKLLGMSHVLLSKQRTHVVVSGNAWV